MELSTLRVAKTLTWILVSVLFVANCWRPYIDWLYGILNFSLRLSLFIHFEIFVVIRLVWFWKFFPFFKKKILWNLLFFDYFSDDQTEIFWFSEVDFVCCYNICAQKFNPTCTPYITRYSITNPYNKRDRHFHFISLRDGWMTWNTETAASIPQMYQI